MKKRALIIGSVIIGLAACFAAIATRKVLPEESSLSTFSHDVRTAKRIFGNDYAGYLAAIKRYGDQAFSNANGEQAESALKRQGAVNLRKAFERDLMFDLEGVAPELPNDFQARPHFSLHTDPLSTGSLGFSLECDLALSESSENVRKAMIQAGGFLKEIALRPGFAELTRNYPAVLSGSLTYIGDNRFDLQMKFLSQDLNAMSIRYAAYVLVEPEEVRYLSWLPITYKRAKGTVAKIETDGEDRNFQFAYAQKDVISSLHHLDLKIDYPEGVRSHYTKSENELDTLPVETPGIQFVPPITTKAIEKLKRFQKLNHLVYSDPVNGGTNLSGLSTLRELEHVSVEGELAATTIDSICRLPHLSELYLDVANLTNEGLAKLVAIPTLKWLFINSSRVDAQGMEAVARSQSVKALTFGESVVLTDRGVEALGRMDSLQALHFYVPPNVNLVPIYRMKNLEVLGLSKLRLTAKDIDALTSMTQLQGLMLDEIIGVTREQLLSFSKLKNLREFYFNQRGTPASDMRRLRSMLPGRWLRN